jgi:hypothetical protein
MSESRSSRLFSSLVFGSSTTSRRGSGFAGFGLDGDAVGFFGSTTCLGFGFGGGGGIGRAAFGFGALGAAEGGAATSSTEITWGGEPTRVVGEYSDTATAPT